MFLPQYDKKVPLVFSDTIKGFLGVVCICPKSIGLTYILKGASEGKYLALYVYWNFQLNISTIKIIYVHFCFIEMYVPLKYLISNGDMIDRIQSVNTNVFLLKCAKVFLWSC